MPLVGAEAANEVVLVAMREVSDHPRLRGLYPIYTKDLTRIV
jgi:hypothetical protein